MASVSEMQLMTMFCDIDDFCKRFASIFHRHLLNPGQGTRLRQPAPTLSERMTLIVYFRCSHYRTFKHYYTDYVGPHLRPYCPTHASYTRPDRAYAASACDGVYGQSSSGLSRL